MLVLFATLSISILLGSLWRLCRKAYGLAKSLKPSSQKKNMPIAHEDRISQLTDELLLHILSFLPKPRAQTCILSHRFHHLWTNHPDMHFSIPYSPDSGEEINEAIAESYIYSVDRCLQSFNSPVLRSFSIDLWLPLYKYKTNCQIADRWLCFACTHSVRNLTIRTLPSHDVYPSVPCSLFNCSSVEDLTVHSTDFKLIPEYFKVKGFPNLKKLHIISSSIENEILQDLLCSCPALEFLELENCAELTHVEISTQNLPRLMGLIVSSSENNIGGSIEAPNLKSIHFKGNLRDLNWKGSSILSNADISSTILKPFKQLVDWMKMVHAISNVSVLKVADWFFQFKIPKGNSSSPVFMNLKELSCNFELMFSNSALHALTYVLGGCPLLAKLTIELNCITRSHFKDMVRTCSEDSNGALKNYMDFLPRMLSSSEEYWGEGDSSVHSSELDCSLYHLKIVSFKQFVGSKNEMTLVKFLFRKAVVLEKFIVFDLLKREEPELQELFVGIPRVSSHVQMRLMGCQL